jgi:protein-S-isoprenylcysteine O-methyltransferase Ste14
MIDTPQLLLFVLFTAVAVVWSRHAWQTRQTYGFFRFLAFETLFLLIVKNVEWWFDDPLVLRQIVSWVLLAGSIGLAVHGFYLLRAIGQAQINIIEGTQTVVETGAYRYIRHPLYGSLLLATWGAFLKHVDGLGVGLALGATAFLIATARYEEEFNVDRFGAAYEDYMTRTKMFIPFGL